MACNGFVDMFACKRRQIKAKGHGQLDNGNCDVVKVYVLSMKVCPLKI